MLPHLKLAAAGLKSSYALGERVELQCSSDFSRPPGALAWFINGQRVSCSAQPSILNLSRPCGPELGAQTSGLLID